MNMLKAPLELEDRLRSALGQVPVKKKNKSRKVTWFASAAAALLLIVGTYQYPALAYYGDKLLSRNELSSLSFTEVAEKGYGQTVNKSTTLDDGTVITINGVIADDNGMLMYYTIDRLTGSVSNDDEYFRLRYSVDNIKGFLTDSYPKEGYGNFDRKNETHYEGVYKFEPVSPFSRTLTVTFSESLDNGEQALYPISFKFEANKAMNSIIKEDISKSISVDQGSIHYDSITASPSSTIVKGHYELNGNGGYPMFFGKTKLYVNGTEVKYWGGRSGYLTKTGAPGYELEFDVFPTDKIETIELVLETSAGFQKVEKPISLASPSDQSFKIGDQKVWIRSVTKTETGYDIVIARKQFTIPETDNLSIQAGGKKVPVSSISSSRQWDLQNGNILWEQTYSFNTTDQPEFLLIDGFYYIKTYNKSISIPVDSNK